MADREPTVTEEPTIGKLVVDAVDDLGTLVRNLISLAKAELKVSVRAGGLAVGLFVVAAFLLLLSVVMVSIAIALFIAMAGLDPAWGFLIVFGGYVLLAVVLVAFGVRSIKKVRSPERTLHQASEMPKALRGH